MEYDVYGTELKICGDAVLPTGRIKNNNNLNLRILSAWRLWSLRLSDNKFCRDFVFDTEYLKTK
jgi:hypothetical protein